MWGLNHIVFGVTKMSHRIRNNMLAYKVDKPWHGLGVEVDVNASGLDMLKAAKMDWRVQRRALAMRDNFGNGLVIEPLKNYKAIVRADTQQVFQIATDRYNPVQNEEIVEFFHEFCNAGHASMETVGAIDGGAKVFALAKLTSASDMVLGKSDQLRGYLLLATSHDGSMRTIGKATSIRVVCWNTLNAAIGEDSQKEFRMKHSKKFSEGVKEQAKRIMGMAIEQIQQTHEFAKEMSQVRVDSDGRIEFVLRLLDAQQAGSKTPLLDAFIAHQENQQKPVLEQIIMDQEYDSGEAMGRVGRTILDCIIDSPGSELDSTKDTLWGCINGVSYYTDHLSGRTQDTRLSNAWFGSGDEMKTNAIQVAKDMSGIPDFGPILNAIV